ncbi:hypothetical protein C8J57DRAFT_1600106 [Mycena rebaudengoi]|nr:hypothetical protein C8J57DRAFT_1600106 [Mycena rebaudengoi]
MHIVAFPSPMIVPDESCFKAPPGKKPVVDLKVQRAQPVNSFISRNLQDDAAPLLASQLSPSEEEGRYFRSLRPSRKLSNQMKWSGRTGLRLINPDTFFTNPTDILHSYVQSTDNAVTRFSRLAAAPDTDTGALIDLVASTLTAIALGNQTIANTIAYINEVEFDKARQAAFDQAHARESVLKIILNIEVRHFASNVPTAQLKRPPQLLILSVVPGVGEVADIVAGGVDTFGLISKAMDAFSLAKTLDKDSDIFKLFGAGLRTEDEIADAAEGAEAVIGAEARETRGALGDSVGKVQDTAIQKKPEEPCVFNLYSAAELKISSSEYRALCEENNLPMAIPGSLNDPTETTTGSYITCVTKYEGSCQCDHLFEQSVRCFGDLDSTAEIKAIFNDKSSSRSKANGFNPNAVKKSLTSAYKSDESFKRIYQKYQTVGMKLVFDTANAPNGDVSMVKIAKSSEDHATDLIKRLRTAEPVKDEADPNDTAEDAAESEDKGRGKSKRPLSPGSTGTCSDDPEAARKKIKPWTTSVNAMKEICSSPFFRFGRIILNNEYCDNSYGHTVTEKHTVTETKYKTVPTTVTMFKTETRTRTDTEHITQVYTSTKMVPTTRIWASSEIIDKTKTIDHTLTAIETSTAIKVHTKTETETDAETETDTKTLDRTITNFMRRTVVSTMVVPTTYLKTWVTTPVVDKTKTVEKTKTATVTEDMTRFETKTKTDTLTDRVTMTDTMTVTRPTTILSVWVSTSIKDKTETIRNTVTSTRVDSVTETQTTTHLSTETATVTTTNVRNIKETGLSRCLQKCKESVGLYSSTYPAPTPTGSSHETSCEGSGCGSGGY